MSRPFYIHEIHRPISPERRTNAELIAKTLGSVLIDHDASMGRNHQLVQGLVHPKRSVEFIASMIERSERQESPVQPYLIFRGRKTFDRLVGLAVVIENVPLYYRKGRRDTGKQLEAPTTQIQVVLGVGAAELFEMACRQVRETTTTPNVVSIEPSHGVSEVHDVLAQVFGPPREGYFSGGLKYSKDTNLAYGLQDEL